LVSTKTGRHLASLDTHIAAASLPARVSHDVWAFPDYDSTKVVLHDVRTGRVVRRLRLPRRACNTGDGDDESSYISCSGIRLHATSEHLVVMPAVRPGDVMVVDLNGKLVAEYALPMCQ
jgi:hypothetical protein